MRASDRKDVIGQLIAAARSGDRSARDELFCHVLPDLRAYIRLRADAPLRLRESESDLVQSTCREVLDHLSDFEYRGPARFRSWIFTVALNKIREKARFHRADRRNPAREQRVSHHDERELVAAYRGIANPCQGAIANEEMQRFEAAFDRLDPAHQDVILWSRLAGLSHTEIAARMERSEQAVRSLLSRALARLATLLDAPAS